MIGVGGGAFCLPADRSHTSLLRSLWSKDPSSNLSAGLDKLSHDVLVADAESLLVDEEHEHEEHDAESLLTKIREI